MNNNILESAVVSRLPVIKARSSTLDAMARTKKANNYYKEKELQQKVTYTAEETTNVDSDIPILLMDKDQSSRNAIRIVGRQKGFKIYGVGSYDQALRTFEVRDDIGVIMVNVRHNLDQMEQMLELVKDRYPATSVIALADVENMEWVTDLINRGLIFCYISNPFEDEDLQRAATLAQKRYKMLNRIGKLKDDFSNDMQATTMNKLKSIFRKSA